MIDRFLAKVFGTQHERDIKKLLPRVARINALEPGMQKLSDEALRGKTEEFRARIAKALEGVPEEELKSARAEALDGILEEAFAVAREASVRALGMRPFDVQLIGGMVLHQGKIAEMKTGEGKTLVANDARLPQRPHRAGRPRRDRQRLPRPPRRRVDGKDLHLPGPDGRVHPEQSPGRRAAEGLRLRRHLRNQQRVRLRLPARQHEVRDRVDGPAQPRLRDRRRSRFDPDRRGPHPAHHLGALRGEHRRLLPLQPGHPAPVQGQGREGQAREQDDDRRLPRRREGPHGRSDRRGRGEGREAARHRQHVRADQHRPPPRRRAGPAGPRALPPRRRVHDQGRPGPDRRRVHRPRPARAPVVRRASPGRRGQGERQDRAGEPDPRDDHPPELFPPLREARRHDGHGRHGSRRSSTRSTSSTWSSSRRTAHDPRRTTRTSSTPRSARSTKRSPTRSWHSADKGQPVLVGTVSIEKSETALRAPEGAQGPARRPEREVPREGSRDRRPGRPLGLGDHRDEHGRPRNRHRARRQPRRRRRARAQRTSKTREPSANGVSPGSARVAPRTRRRSSPRAGCTSSAPSGTSPAASTTSSGAARAARATRAPPGSTFPSRTT